jgi:glycosyltransferase involved in cell wall biosynthesis
MFTDKNITALLPVKNGSRYIENSLSQIKPACRSSDEILVIDDFSEDGTATIVQKAMKTDSRIRLIQNRVPGFVNALNLGLKETSNDWVARFDVDDNYEIDRLIEQRKKIDSEVIGIFTDYDFFNEEFNYLGMIPSAIDSNSVSLSLVSSTRTAHPSILFCKEAVMSVGGYREEDFPAEDLSLWLRMSRIGKLISTPKILLHYRLSKNSITGTKRLEALKKKNDLLHTIGINPKNSIYCVNNLEIIIENYKSYPNFTKRELLFIRDLLLYSKINSKINYTKMLYLKNIVGYSSVNLIRIQKIKSIIDLYNETISRNKARNRKL